MAAYSYQCPICSDIKIVEHKAAATPYIRCNKCAHAMIRALNPIKKDKDGRDKSPRP